MPAAFQQRPTFELRTCNGVLQLGARTVVMGILNCTPDSFSDGGEFVSSRTIEDRLSRMADEGADCIDIGGESTRPGAEPVDAEQEWSRVAPAFAAARTLNLSIPLSVDTTKALVAARALEAGATLINDVSALKAAPELAELAAEFGAALILMHMKGEPRTMQQDPRYEDLLTEIPRSLAQSVRVARERGVQVDQLVIDPGIGFGKTADQNLDLIAALPAFAELGLPILVGASRKSFLGKLFDLPVDQRVEASCAVHVGAILAGAHFIRVHDVKESVRAARVADALLARAGGD